MWEELPLAFALFDRDGSGVLDPLHLKRDLLKLGVKLRENELHALMAGGFVDYRDFIKDLNKL